MSGHHRDRMWMEKLKRAALECAGPFPSLTKRSALPERHTEPDPTYELLDSRGQPISLPELSILKRRDPA